MRLLLSTRVVITTIIAIAISISKLWVVSNSNVVLINPSIDILWLMELLPSYKSGLTSSPALRRVRSWNITSTQLRTLFSRVYRFKSNHDKSHGRRANARNVNYRNSCSWANYIINSLKKKNLLTVCSYLIIFAD